jgi:FkbM family methyltransferase
MMTPRVLGRKLRTFLTVVARCVNWPQVAAGRLGLLDRPVTIRLRDGPQIDSLHSLRTTFGEIFEAAVADVYGIRNARADLVVDVGANIGAFTCLAAYCLPKATIYAFEPSALHADQCERNVTRNRLENVVVQRAAVTRDGRDVRFHVNGDGGSSGLFLPGDREVALPSVSLDAVDFSGSRRAFIKLDCEGAEGEIIDWICHHLPGLPASLTIACEWHGWCPVPMTDAVATLRQHEFGVETPLLFDEQYLFASRGR